MVHLYRRYTDVTDTIYLWVKLSVGVEVVMCAELAC